MNTPSHHIPRSLPDRRRRSRAGRLLRPVSAWWIPVHNPAPISHSPATSSASHHSVPTRPRKRQCLRSVRERISLKLTTPSTSLLPTSKSDNMTTHPDLPIYDLPIRQDDKDDDVCNDHVDNRDDVGNDHVGNHDDDDDKDDNDDNADDEDNDNDIDENDDDDESGSITTICTPYASSSSFLRLSTAPVTSTPLEITHACASIHKGSRPTSQSSTTGHKG